MKRYHIFIIMVFSILLLTITILNSKMPDGWITNAKVKYIKNTFTIEASKLTYTYQEAEGDKTITAKVNNLNNNTFSEIGVRTDPDDESSSVPLKGVAFKSYWVRVVRKGNIISKYISEDGKSWTLHDEVNIPKLSDKIYMGMSVVSLDGKSAAKAAFSNVEITESSRLKTKCTEIIGSLRIQILTPSLVRIEEKGPKGYEDRTTFHIEERNWIGAVYEKKTKGDYVYISTEDFVIKVKKNANSVNRVEITKADGLAIWEPFNESNSKWLPEPYEKTEAWSIIDSPRIIPSEYGFMPAEGDLKNNGWDLDNNATDIYVFLPKGDYKTLRQDFIELTGRTDMIPLYALGSWDSKYFAYTEKTALQQIDNYRKGNIPLDVLVIDTDWRVGGSDGYTINTKLFPDIENFFQQAHDKNVRVMFNDHPGSVASALSKEEIIFRSEGLSLLLNKGLDIWWYDRNWTTGLSPLEGINKEVWGMEIYRFITDYLNGNLRPLIMANFDGIDNGILSRAPNIAAHRYPIQWTGDTYSSYLQKAIENMVYVGVCAPFPYLSEDLGGHFDTPTPELYIRWIQFGALSPVYRVHCSSGFEREPWKYGDLAETIAREYINMRYRLLPLFYTASRNNYDTGEPILRRLDLDYPEYEEARRNDQYLLGSNILIAPVYEGYDNLPVPKGWFTTPDGKTGLLAEYFNNDSLSGEPVLSRTDSQINYDWKMNSPASDINSNNFTVRWTGSMTVKGNSDVNLVFTTDDGIRLWVDDMLILDKWSPQNSIENVTDFVFRKGSTYKIRIEYLEIEGNAKCQVYARSYTGDASERELWLPPGRWIDAWTGEIIEGNKVITKSAPINVTPIYIKEGTIVPLAPEMQYTGEKPHDPITLDIYPTAETSLKFELYEDDTLTEKYKKGEFRTTKISVTSNNNTKSVKIDIGKAQGDFDNSIQNRSWVIRLRKPAGWTDLNVISVTGEGVDHRIIERDPDAMPFANSGSSPDNDVIEIVLSSETVYKERSIVITFK